MGLIQEKVVVGPLACNCMILGCEETKEAVIIDPGDEAEKIITSLENQGLKAKYLLHTHAHFDHVCGTKGVKEKTQGITCLHSGDELLYKNLPMQGQMFGMQLEEAPTLDKFIEDEEILKFGNYEIQVIHTPGHSPGSVSFKLLGGPEHIYSGDTLFKSSIGRADLWGGDGDLLIRSIKDRLLRFEGEIEVFPGHGDSTRIGDEKATNPFLA